MFVCIILRGFSAGSLIMNSPAGDINSVLQLGRSPGEVNGNSLQYSCLGKHVDRGAWWAPTHGVAKELGTT